MAGRIGIRLEDKNKWERRTPLVPLHVNKLVKEYGLEVCVQSSPIRAFSDAEYEQAGARIVEDISKSPVVFAVKEIPPDQIADGQTLVFFSHTIKGQVYNMPMLQRILDLDCQLVDYEKIIDTDGRRLVYFGNYAGLAGMIDTLWALGRRLEYEGFETPFRQIRQTYKYSNLEQAKAAILKVGQVIARDGLSQSLTPLICGFAGYGNVSRGAQEIFDLLPVREVNPSDLMETDACDPHYVYKAVFKEQDLVEPVAPSLAFDLQDYYDRPEKYRSKFSEYVPFLTILVNGIYWSERYPRLVTKRFLKGFFERKPNPRLRVIGDISCDTEGAIECNVRSTSPGDPIYVYDPITESILSGHKGRGVVILAVDNLPCELPRESSTHFSTTLMPFVPEIALANYDLSFEDSDLPATIKHAVITWHGELTPNFRYLDEYL
jgi:alpha-aminoadipic semialdehyde synthase